MHILYLLLNILIAFENMNNYFRDSASEVGALADNNVIIPITYMTAISIINI